MINLPIVSIALCTYNGAKFLEEQLDSLVVQTYKNIEVVVVDDCSTDNTYNILMEYAARYPNFSVYRNEQNVGFLRNFEKALTYCNGEFIALCDQDDIWYPEKIELQMAAIGNNMILYHDSEFIDDEGSLLGEKISDDHNFYSGNEPKVFLFRNCVSGHAMLIRKELLQYALPFKDNFYHDWWLTYVAVNVGSIHFIPQCLVKYRRHTESNTVKDVLTKSQRILQNIKWLELCSSYTRNRDPEFVKTLFELYKKRTHSFTAKHLRDILIKNRKSLFFIDIRSDKLILAELKRYFWGLKAKNIWYTYVSPKPGKVFSLKEKA